MTFTGLPAVMNKPDVPPETKISFTVEVVEDLSDELRRSVTDPHGFDCEVTHREYRFKLRDCKLSAPLAERDYSNHRLQITFATLRQNILDMNRPMGQPDAPDHADVWIGQLNVMVQRRDQLKQKRLELQQYEAEVVQRRAMLEDAENALEARKKHLFSTGTPELLAMAKGRGF